jgi:hypothetical protein
VRKIGKIKRAHCFDCESTDSRADRRVNVATAKRAGIGIVGHGCECDLENCG